MMTNKRFTAPPPPQVASHEFRAPTSILLIKPGSLGDVVHALPCAKYIKTAWPDTTLTWIIDPRWKSILDDNPYIDALIEFPRTQFRGFKGTLRAIRWLAKLRTMRPDLALDLQGLLRSAIVARASRPKFIQGGSDAREGASLLYSSIARVNKHAHAVDRYRQVVSALGIDTSAKPEFFLPSGIKPLIQLPNDFVVFHPYSRGKGKSFSPADVVTFCRTLSPYPVVLVGTTPESIHYPNNTINLLNQTTLRELIWILAHAQFVVTVDSGPAHMAAAITDRLLTVHTWSNPARVGPYCMNSWIWQGGQIRPQNLNTPPLPTQLLTSDAAQQIAEWTKKRIG